MFGVGVRPDPDDEHTYPVVFLLTGDIADLIRDAKPWQWVTPDTSPRSPNDPEDTPRPES